MEKTNSKFSGLTGFQLKVIGIILMVFDHIHQFFHQMGAPAFFNMLGRPVAPIFLFLSAEGFHYTRSKKKYVFRLWLAYVLMGIATAIIAKIFPTEMPILNSIFGTLCLCTFYMGMVELFKKGIKEKQVSKIILSIAGMVIPYILNILIFPLFSVSLSAGRALMLLVPLPSIVEGGTPFIVMAVAFYLLQGKSRWIQIIPLIILSVVSFALNPADIQWMMIFAAIPILLYNGKQGKKSKYFFYFFYPIHIYILYIIAYFIQK